MHTGILRNSGMHAYSCHYQRYDIHMGNTFKYMYVSSNSVQLKLRNDIAHVVGQKHVHAVCAQITLTVFRHPVHVYAKAKLLA